MKRERELWQKALKKILYFNVIANIGIIYTEREPPSQYIQVLEVLFFFFYRMELVICIESMSNENLNRN